MGCNKFKKYQLGKLSEEGFFSHKNGCSYCQNQEKMDVQLMTRIKSEKKNLEAPHLWDRIEASLMEEQKMEPIPEKRIIKPRIPRFAKPVFAAISVFLLTAGLLIFFWLFTGKTTSSKLLDQTALKKVEEKESEYIQAIDRLEQGVKPKLVNLDLELMLLYKDRLQTIDDQIERCREALAKNPANTHIRKYLLAAFQDKKDTLREIIRVQPHFENGT